jgi:hypothetical protein
VSGLTVEQARALRDIVKSVPNRLGLFRNTLGAEPKNAPGMGITCSVFCHAVTPILRSSIAATSLRVEFHVRLQIPWSTAPEEDLDPVLMSAAVAVMGGYAAGLRLSPAEAAGIDVRAIDIRGMEGVSMAAPFGTLDHDGKKYRAVLITVPILLNNVLTEVP